METIEASGLGVVARRWWLAAVVPLGIALFTKWWLLLIPFAVLAIVATWLTVRGMKTGSVLHCDALPLPLGAPFRGHITTDFAADELWLELKCVKYGADSGDATVLWEDRRLVKPGEPFEFELPADGISSGQAIRWFLDVSAPGYSVSFDLPVTAAGTPAAARS